jgi:hypothetical protein
MVVEKISRNAVAELVNQARNRPQRGDLGSANPAWVALAELAASVGVDGLALGLRNETGEISFLDLGRSFEEAASGGAFVDRETNKILWRRLKKLVNILVDRNMLGPRKPIRPPEDPPDAWDPSGEPPEDEIAHAEAAQAADGLEAAAGGIEGAGRSQKAAEEAADNMAEELQERLQEASEEAAGEAAGEAP